MLLKCLTSMTGPQGAVQNNTVPNTTARGRNILSIKKISKNKNHKNGPAKNSQLFLNSPQPGKAPQGAASPVPSNHPTEHSSPTRQIPLETRESAVRADTASATGSAGPGSELPQPQRASTPPLRTVAFEEFKHERGSEINRILTENKGNSFFIRSSIDSKGTVMIRNLFMLFRKDNLLAFVC